MSILNYIFNLFFGEFSFFGYFVLMLIAMLEATPMFGFFVPGQVVAVGAGILAKFGSLQLMETLLVFSVGAIAGDLIGYYLGAKYGENFILKYGKYFYLKDENFKKTKALIQEHAGKTIIGGRFNSITRALTPFTAGATCVPFYKFLFFDTLGGISWAITFTGIGYLFGNNYKIITDYFGEFFLIAFIIGATIVYAYKKINQKRRIFHRRHLYILLINLSALYILSRMLENFVNQELIVDFDYWLNSAVEIFRHPYLNNFFIFITHLAGTITMIILGFIALIFFITRKKWRYSLILLLAMSGGKIIEVLIKNIIGRNRPDNALVETVGYSLPSGHATIAIIFYSILIYYFKNHIRNIRLKYTLITLCAFIIFAVGFSRIYLGAHWFSDVVAGFSLGAFWLTLIILFLEFVTTVFREKVGKIKKYLNRN
ncbi:MAG: bifunctional DedA family/phosphatase PAP2 family protein [Candidatus Moraniibacteriota bacterium]